MGVSKNRVFSPQIIHFNRGFHYFHHPFWGVNTPIFGSTPISFSRGVFQDDVPFPVWWDMFFFPGGDCRTEFRESELARTSLLIGG